MIATHELCSHMLMSNNTELVERPLNNMYVLAANVRVH